MNMPILPPVPTANEALAHALVDMLPAARRTHEIPRTRPGGIPKANCHDMVDAWVATHPGTEAVRGWLAVMTDGPGWLFCAHSVVRQSDGALIDVTFSEAEPKLPFVPHPRSTGGFFSFLCANPPVHELRINMDPD